MVICFNPWNPVGLHKLPQDTSNYLCSPMISYQSENIHAIMLFQAGKVWGRRESN